MKVFAYLISLFSDKPQRINRRSAWFYKKGVMISEYQLFKEIFS
jgi:hypothetical protein